MSIANLSFFEIDKLDLDEPSKDELRLAFMHGIDITKYVKRNKTSEHLREYRLAIQTGVEEEFINTKVGWEVIRYVRMLKSQGYSLDFLRKYMPNPKGRPVLEEDTLVKVLKCQLNHDTTKINFLNIKHDLVNGFIYGLSHDYDLTPLVRVGLTLDKDTLYMLISLIGSNIDVRPFTNKKWSNEQIEAILRAKPIINPSDLIKNFVSTKFTEGQIEEVVRGIKFGNGELVSKTDEQGYPIYNEYQMYEIVEGLRFELLVTEYCDPNMSDFDMRTIREQLLNQKDLHGHNTRGKLRVLKPKYS
ncbi:hypothetical protein COF68_05310 [Bacillus toyonensis]|uniref:hypothetical protein n=1 Tax=Bacillus toyonensis TaxID=155322 RepID=UPI000BFCE722|nr:hypothetical protein [Bacillus toyonensis]PHE64261.1 hypothetical protein COF68_05310 [Bacillus toyonensis]